MKNQVLSIEQMQHLQELGVDTSNAKMSWYAIYETEPNWYNELNIRDDVFDKNYPSVPTFTLQEMLEMMPDVIEQNNILFFLSLKKQYCHYMCGYVSMLKREGLCFFACENILTCAYKTLCWLAENGCLKGGKK